MIYNEYFKMYQPENLHDMKSVIGKTIKFLYWDYDGGPTSGTIVIKEILNTQKNRFGVNCEIIEGEPLYGFYFYPGVKFAMAGDDSDELLIQVLNPLKN